MPNPIALSLRKTVFDHGVSPDDYRVIWSTEHHGDRRVGRILRGASNNQWSWHLQPDGPVPAWGNGIAMTLQEATTQFRAAWERYAALQAGDDWVAGLKEV
jgi:hypothetical protein